MTTPSDAINQVKQDVLSDLAAAKTDATTVAAQVRAEYSALSIGAQARLAQLVADIESAEQVSMDGIKTLFGVKL